MASIPFMLMIGNGNYFGKYVVPVVGVSLFIRAGLANLSSPVDSALSMDVIPKDLRPVLYLRSEFYGRYCEYIEWSFYRKDFICPPIWVSAGLFFSRYIICDCRKCSFIMYFIPLIIKKMK